jgi:hypothetical protein
MNRSKIVVILNSIVGRFGFILIELREIRRMEQAAEDYAKASKRAGIGERDAGYFNGLSDYAGKKAAMLRQRYTSNKP